MRHFDPVQKNRRTFLKRACIAAAVAAGLGSFWAAKSNTRSARLLRQILADNQRKILPAPAKPNPATWSDNDITIAWLGHATTLINFYGVHILTDPALGNHIGVALGVGTAGPKRYVAPALRVEELPPIDVLLLSHAHFDHLDVATLGRLEPKSITVTAKITSDVLSGTGLTRIMELPWRGRTTAQCANGDLEIEAIEVKHWGRRWPTGIDRGYNGYVLRREGKSLLFGGDSALTPLFAEVRSRGPFAAAIMPIGAYDPWIRNHCTPEEAVEMANQAGADYLVPVHHQTFKLSNEPMLEPIERFQAALRAAPERIALRQIGEHFVCPRT